MYLDKENTPHVHMYLLNESTFIVFWCKIFYYKDIYEVIYFGKYKYKYSKRIISLHSKSLYN